MNRAIQKNSISGQKLDSVESSLGYVGGMVALQALGVPWQVTSGTSTFGNEMTEAIGQGANWKDATISSLISTGAEVGSEYLFGGIKLPGH